MRYQSKIVLLLLAATLSQLSYSGVIENIERDITENPFEIIESEGFADVNSTEKKGLTISGGIGPQFIYEKTENDYGKNRSYQYSPFLGYFSLPDYGISTTFEIKRSISKWRAKGNSEDEVDKAWEYTLTPRYYLGYYFGAPTDLVAEFTYMDKEKPKGGTYDEFEYLIGIAQRRPNLYTEIRFDHETKKLVTIGYEEEQEAHGFDMTIKPFTQDGKFTYELELYVLYQNYWKSKTYENYLEFHATPGIIYDFGGGKKLSLRTEIGKKDENKIDHTWDEERYYWKATLGYEFMVTENLAGLIELEYEKANIKAVTQGTERKETIKKVTASLNYRF